MLNSTRDKRKLILLKENTKQGELVLIEIKNQDCIHPSPGPIFTITLNGGTKRTITREAVFECNSPLFKKILKPLGFGRLIKDELLWEKESTCRKRAKKEFKKLLKILEQK